MNLRKKRTITAVFCLLALPLIVLGQTQPVFSWTASCTCSTLTPGKWQVTSSVSTFSNNDFIVDDQGNISWESNLDIRTKGQCVISTGTKDDYSGYIDNSFNLDCTSNSLSIKESGSTGVNPKDEWSYDIQGNVESNRKISGTMYARTTLTAVNTTTGEAMSCTGTASGTWTAALVNSCSNMAPPSPPESIGYSTQNEDGEFTVSWSKVDNALKYRLERATDPQFRDSKNVYEGENTSFYEKDLDLGQYYYRVRATDFCGHTSEWHTETEPYEVTIWNGTCSIGRGAFSLASDDSAGSLHNKNIAALGDDGFVWIFINRDPDSNDYLYGQLFDGSNNKIGSRFKISTDTDYWFLNGGNYAVTTLVDGRFVVVWSATRKQDSTGRVYGQIYSSSGNKVGNTFQVNDCCDSTNGTDVTSTTDGGFLVVWSRSCSNSEFTSGIFGQFYDRYGNKKGQEFIVEEGCGTNNRNKNYRRPGVVNLSNGGYIVTYLWNDNEIAAYVWGQRLDQKGNIIGDPLWIRAEGSGSNNYSLAALPDGFVVVWGSNFNYDGNYGQIFNNSGTAVSEVFQICPVDQSYVNETYSPLAVDAFPNGNFIVTWGNENGVNVWQKIYDQAGNSLTDVYEVKLSAGWDSGAVSVAVLNENEWITAYDLSARRDAYDIPTTPSKITYPATNTTGNFSVTWTTVNGATRYDLERSTSSEFTKTTTLYEGALASYSQENLETGSYYYRVKARNNCGESDWVAGGEIKVEVAPDTEGPSLNIASHVNGKTVTTAEITLAGTASDDGFGDNGIQQVTVNGTRANSDTASGGGTANWSRTMTLTPGANTLTVVAYDNSSNHNQTTQTLTINYDATAGDTTSPSLDITSHTPGQTVTTAEIILSGTASDAGRGENGIQQVTVNGTRANSDTASGGGTANWSKSLKLSDGSNAISVMAYDNSSNHNTTMVNITIIYENETSDLEGPSLVITSHANHQIVTTSSIVLKGTASDSGLGNNGVQQVTVNGIEASWDNAVGSNTAYWSKTVKLSEGANTLEVIAYDNSDNHNATVKTLTMTMEVDNRQKWRFDTGSVRSSPAIAPDGTVYVGSDDHHLYAINPDGTEKWRFQTDYFLDPSPAIGPDDIVYAPSCDGNLYSLYPEGGEKWRFQTGDEIYTSSALGHDGLIFIGSYAKNLFAINPDGTEKWRFQAGLAVSSSPAISVDGIIYVGSNDNYLYAVNPDGTEKWHFQAGDEIHSSPAIGADGTIYVGSYDKNLYAINPDGTEKWRFETGSYGVRSSPAIGVDGTIYVGSYDKNLYAINPDGTEKWRFETGDYVTSSPAIGVDGIIYIGSCDNNLYAVNPDGTEKWRFETGDEVLSSPVIGSDGTVYFGSKDGNLYAIQSDSMGLANSPWPMFLHDEKHTGRADSGATGNKKLVLPFIGLLLF